MILYIYIVFMAGVKRYWMAYRAVQAFTDPRKPVVYLRALHADDVVERQETPDSPESRMLVALGRLHKWLTGSPNPMTRYSLEEDIAPYFRRLGPFLSIGRPTEFAQMIGSTRIYVEDNYWQSVVLDLLVTAEFVVVRADISSGLSWKIEQVFRKMSAERIVLLLADKYGNPYAEEQYVTLLSVLPQDVCVMLPNTLGNIWYIYFKPGEIPCTVSRENGISDIRGATAALLRQISGCQGIVTTKDNLAPDDDLDVLAMVAAAIVIVGIMVVLLDVLRITFM